MTAFPGVAENRADGTGQPCLLLPTSLALLTLVPIAAYQLGVLDHLPDPPGNIFASDKIAGSSAAHPLGIPDSLLGLASYTVTLSLILLAKKRPGLGKLLAAKLAADGSAAAFNLGRQVISFRKLCSWCTGTAVCTGAMVYAGRYLMQREAAEVRDSN
jgi:uncharacterized membrane protein